MRLHRFTNPIQIKRTGQLTSVGLFGTLFGLLAVVSPSALAVSSNGNAAAQAYRAQLQSNVDTANGAPRSGRDPAMQIQSSLSDAASRPVGLGLQTDTPAAGIKGSMHHVQPSQVIPNTKATRVLASGCLLDYGAPGQQCLPAYYKSGSIPSSCSVIRKLFPKGISVNGADALGLGKNAAGIACTG